MRTAPQELSRVTSHLFYPEHLSVLAGLDRQPWLCWAGSGHRAQPHGNFGSPQTALCFGAPCSPGACGYRGCPLPDMQKPTDKCNSMMRSINAPPHMQELLLLIETCSVSTEAVSSVTDATTRPHPVQRWLLNGSREPHSAGHLTLHGPIKNRQCSELFQKWILISLWC